MKNEDLSLFFRDFAVIAIYGGEQADVILDSPDQVFVGDDIISADYQMTYPATALKALKYNDLITVDCAEYRVNSVQAIEDGRLKVARLSKL